MSLKKVLLVSLKPSKMFRGGCFAEPIGIDWVRYTISFTAGNETLLLIFGAAAVCG